MERLLASGLPGYTDLLHFCRDLSTEKDQPELLSAAKQAQMSLTGWPLGIVLDRDEFRPRSTGDGIVAVVNAHLPSPARHSLDYWALSRWGDFYALRSLSENKLDKDRAQRNIWFDVRIVRAAEALLHCASLHKAFGTDPNSQIELNVRYGGLLGRELTSVNPMWSYRGTNVHDDHVRIGPLTFRLGDVDAELIPLVKRLCGPLFVIFDFTEISDDVYEKIVTDFVSGGGANLGA